MDPDLDNDLFWESDNVKDFLQNKLEEIQENNTRLEEMIKRRQQIIFSTMLDPEKSAMEEDLPTVSFLSKKIYNGKCIIVFEIENSSNHGVQNLKVFLNLEASSTISYKMYIITEEKFDCYKKCNKITHLYSHGTEISKKGLILLILDTPLFLDKLSFNITGYIFCTIAIKDVHLSLPSVEFTSLDITNTKLNEISVHSGNVADLFTIMFCSIRTGFVMILPKGFTNNLTSIFEIHCFLTPVNCLESCKSYFTAHRICSMLDNSLLEIHSLTNEEIMEIIFYTKNDECLIAFLHYLHQHLPGVMIIPKSVEQKYNFQGIAYEDDIRDKISKFKICIEKEIDAVINYKQYLDCARKDCDICMHLRTNLLKTEKDTDLHYLRITAEN